MKHTNLILDEELLNTASRLFGEKTHSATVNRALSEAIKAFKVRELSGFLGSGIWEGDLSITRDDKIKRRSKK